MVGTCPLSNFKWNVTPVIALLAGLFVGACSGGEKKRSEPASSRPAKKTILFLDATALREVGGDKQVENRFEKEINRVVRKRLGGPDDQIEAFYVQKRTEIKAPKMEIRNTLSDGGETQEFASDQALQDVRAKREKTAFLKNSSTKITSFFQDGEAHIAQQDGAKSDLLGSIEVITSELPPSHSKVKGATSNSERRSGRSRQRGKEKDVAVYYFSDMYHASEDDHRSFEVRPPSSRKEAIAWAKDDIGYVERQIMPAQTASSGTIVNQEAKDLLKGVDIRIITSTTANRNGGEHVISYWKTLFRSLGASEISYN